MTKPLNTRQKRFCDNYVTKGLSIAESVRRAGYLFKSGRSEDFGSYGCKLLKKDRVRSYVQKLREKAFAKDALSFAEKRAFLARAVRADASNPDPDLVQEIVETHGEHGSSKRVKIVSKLEAINIDNKMSGDEYRDRQPQASNPFLFIVSMGKATLQDAQQAASVGALPHQGEVIEAEVSPA